MSKPFRIDATALRRKPKPADEASLRAMDDRAEARGFVGPEPRRGGRQPSPRTRQVHAEVLPGVRDELLEETARRGVTRGVLIEEAWTLYKAARRSTGGG